MPMNVYTLEAVNLVCGDTGTENAPGYSTHLVLASMKLPAMEENYVDFLPGGAPVAIEVNTHINRLEAAFNLNGLQPEVMGIIATSNTQLQRFTAYGLVRERRTGAALQAVATMFGRMGRVNPVDWRRGDLQNYEYSIRSITRYKFEMQPSPDRDLMVVYDWEFFSSRFWIMGPDGVPMNLNEEMINILNLPITAM